MPELFVIMPFGTKEVEHAPGGTLDFDAVYRRLIRPAGESVDWTVSRIDELAKPGAISDHYLRSLLAADLVLAEISVPNGNVFYELGIRQAVAAGGTILLAIHGTVLPFDLSSQRALFYDPKSLDHPSVREAVGEYLRQHTPGALTNPVRGFLERVGLAPSPQRDAAAFERDLIGRIERARNREQLIAVWQWARHLPDLPVAPLLTLADRLASASEWGFGADVLRTAARGRPDDFEIHRQLGWYLLKLGDEHDAESLAAFERALELNPDDPETLGMLGGRYKRLAEYGEAGRLYDRAAGVTPNSVYILVNQAAMAVLEQPENPGRGIALYRALAERLMSASPETHDVWDELVLGEALFAVGDLAAAGEHYSTAAQLATNPKSLASAADQLELLAGVGFRAEDVPRLIDILRGRADFREPVDVTTGQDVSAPDPARGPVLIHLSDVHFAGRAELGTAEAKHRFHEAEDSRPLVEELLDEFRGSYAHFRHEAERLHLVVTGDLTWRGLPEEFGQALEFLRALCHGLGIPHSRVHLIPGNHDVDWPIAKSDPRRRLDSFLRFLIEFYGERDVVARYPFITWPLGFESAPPAANQIVSVALDAQHRLLVCGLNSCVFEDEQHHFGFVGRRQLLQLKRQLTDLDPPQGFVRVALIHHHLHPFPEYLQTREADQLWLDVSTVRDAGVLERELEQLGFDLVLHGHKHKAQTRETRVRQAVPLEDKRRPLIVCGAGSVGCTKLAHGDPNQYQVIEIARVPREKNVEFARLEWRTLPLEPGAVWSTQHRWSIEG